MSCLFRRPKKPTRPTRVVTTEPEATDEEENDGNSISHTLSQTTGQEKERKMTIMTKTKDDQDSRRPSASLLLSFDDDFKDDDEGEVFRVKKSSVSRRLIKQRDREKKESKNPPTSSGLLIKTNKPTYADIPYSYSSGYGTTTNPQKSANLSEKVKKDESFVRVLNGREAEAVDMESGSEEEDESRPHFSRRETRGNKDALSDTLRRTLEQAQIPDANLVHEVRKRRQMVRSLGTPGAPAFIPVNNSVRLGTQKQKSRLIREDDENDHSEEDEDDRLDFSIAGNTTNTDREKRKEAFDAAQEQIDRSDGDSDMEMDEWESQQLRKGVSKVQMNSVALEAIQQKDFFDRDNGQQVSNNGAYNYTHRQIFDNSAVSVDYTIQPAEVSIENIVNGTCKLNPNQVLEILKTRLEELKVSRSRSEQEISGLTVDLELAKSELVETKAALPVLSSRFTLYQKLRGYVTDLVDCLRCKVPVIRSLEYRMTHIMKTRLEHLVERRRQDVRDQLEEVNAMLNVNASGLSSALGDIRSRRAAEREGRRTRRRALREKERQKREMGEIKGAIIHKDGLSSDDEETELETTFFKTQKDSIIRDSERVFEDVNAEFASIDEVLSRFREWRETDLPSYQESFTNLCIPKLIAPFIRLRVLGCDPLTNDTDLMDCDWVRSLIMFGFVEHETMETLTLDPDSRAAPLVFEKVVVSWIDSVVKAAWDPTSARQTRRLVNLVKKLINEWSLGANSKAMHGIMCTVISKFKDAVDNDVFIPIFPKIAMADKCSRASVFSSRQFWFSVKILDNISAWTGLLSDKPLQVLSLDALLTRYILLGIRTGVDVGESAEKANGVVTVLPRLWLTPDADGELPNGIQQLIRCLVFIVQNSDCSLTVNRLAVPEIAKILKTVGAVSEAHLILNKYS